jgi:hypothetical protein
MIQELQQKQVGDKAFKTFTSANPFYCVLYNAENEITFITEDEFPITGEISTTNNGCVCASYQELITEVERLNLTPMAE